MQESNDPDPIFGEQRCQIPRRIVVPVVDGRVAIIGLKNADLHRASRKKSIFSNLESSHPRDLQNAAG